MGSLEKELYEELIRLFKYEPTEHQAEAFLQIAQYLASEGEKEVFILKGTAGTGKTSMLKAVLTLLEKLKITFFPMAPTGRAAKVMLQRTGRNASTIHKFIYTTSTSMDGEIQFKLRENEDSSPSVYIVDEASMIGAKEESLGYFGTGSLLSDLLKYIYAENPHHKLIIIGDPAQLPPVGSSESPALSPHFLKEKFGLKVFKSEMAQVKRQTLESGILRNATSIREFIGLAFQNNMPCFETDTDFIQLENEREAIELYTSLYDPSNLDKVVIITYSNYLATKVNKAIRNYLFDLPASEPSMDLTPSDLIMVVKNYYLQQFHDMPFIANGEMGKVISVYPETKTNEYGLHWCDAEVEFQAPNGEGILLTSKVILDLLFTKDPNLPHAKMQEIWKERKIELEDGKKSLKKSELKKDEFINALQIKFGYAVTAHKAQGGQWEHAILLFEPYFLNTHNIQEYIQFLRWTYTALTRAVSHLYFLNSPFPVE